MGMKQKTKKNINSYLQGKLYTYKSSIFFHIKITKLFSQDIGNFRSTVMHILK